MTLGRFSFKSQRWDHIFPLHPSETRPSPQITGSPQAAGDSGPDLTNGHTAGPLAG